MSKSIGILCRIAALPVAIVLQVAASASLLQPAGAHDPLVRALLWQALAGLAEAVAFHGWLPRRYREPRAPSLLLLWLGCTFVPVFGGLVVLIACLWAAWFANRNDDDPIADVPRPEFVGYLVSRVSPGGSARLQSRLRNTRAPAGDRLSALVAVQGMAPRTTGAILRDLLTDPLEDIRLIAYGRLDQAENEVMQKIFAAGKQLALASRDDERYALNRLLAELNFELVYQNLVQGEVRRYTLQQAAHHAGAALDIDSGDAALWLLRGRIALLGGVPDDAFAFMSRARDAGFPHERLVPWLAEAHFLRGDFTQVPPLFASSGDAVALPVLRPVIEYWNP